MDALVVAGCAILGIAVGSFLNVVIARVPHKQSVVHPASRCPKCETPIAPRDNIPVVSWLLLRGRCRACGEPISIRYPMVELACGVLFAAVAARFAGSWVIPAYLVFTATLLAVALIDLEHFIVPNRIVFPVAAASVPLLAIGLVDGDHGGDFMRALIGAFVAFGALFALHIISPRGMGMGDVKLAFVLGLYLGWLGWGQVALGLFLGFVLGAVAGVFLIVTRLRSRRDHLPFAPFLAAGAMATVLWGSSILRWYRG
jgi:leader peptidase (prepilin peptidase)/N-methyltransferase